MIILRDPADVQLVSDPFIQALLVQRFKDISIDGYSWDELGFFVVVQPGDSVAKVEQESGAWITTAIFGDARYGDPDFSPCFDVLERHDGHCYELVEIMNDSGFGVVVIIPEVDGMDDELIRFCQEYAQPAPPITWQEPGDLYAPGP